MVLTPEFLMVFKVAMRRGNFESLDEMFDEIRDALGGGEPEPKPVAAVRLSSVEREFLKKHGITERQHIALQLKDGGKAYRELKEKKVAS